jgi:predicted outer membrane repeat protein
VARDGGTLEVTASLLSHSSSSCQGTITSGGNNAASDSTCAFGAVGDVQGAALSLGPLTDNGGPTPTRLPAPGSPAINAIPGGEPGICDGTIAVDQRGIARPQGLFCDRGATEDDDGSDPTRSLVVDDPADQIDLAPGDGQCTTTGGGCTLRAAIDEATANHPALADVITLATDPVLTLAGTGDDANDTGDLDTTGNLTIEGAGHTIDAAGLDRVIHHRGGDLDLVEVTITGGSTTTGTGGGVLAAGTSLRIEASTLVGNVAYDGGGLGLAAGDVTVERSTLSGNTARHRGAAIGGYGAGSTTVRSSTLAANIGDTAIASSLSLGATIVDHGYGDACDSVVTTAGGNRVSDGTCFIVSAAQDLAGVDALLGILADNGGPTPTHLPYATSPVLDGVAVGTAGLCDGTIPVDQRGVARPAGSGCDIGAVEGSSAGPPTPLTLTVDDAGDGGDAVPGDGVCETVGGSCTLRAAVTEANANPWSLDDTITLTVDATLSLTGSGEDANETGDLDVWGDVAIAGGGHTIDAAGIDRVIHHHAQQLAVAEATITGGLLATADALGGGILSEANGTLVIDSSTIDGNHVTGAGGSGGGLAVMGAGDVRRSTLSSNTADDEGGAILANGDLTIVASTISGNTATFRASAIDRAGGTVDLIASTIAANGGSSAIDGVNDYGFAMTGNVVDHEGWVCLTAGLAFIDSGGHNLVSDDTCELEHVTDVQSTEPLLGPLAANGGPTLTHLPGVGSPALDAIPAGTAGLCDGTVAADQRGVARPQGGACDRGSVEQ